MSDSEQFPDRDTRYPTKVAAASAAGIGLGALLIVAALPVLSALAGILLLATIFFGAAANSDAAETKAAALYPLTAVHYKTLPTYSKAHESIDAQPLSVLNPGHTFTEIQVLYRDEAVLTQAPARLRAAGWTCEPIDEDAELGVAPNVACDKAGHSGLGIYRIGKSNVLLIADSTQESWLLISEIPTIRAQA